MLARGTRGLALDQGFVSFPAPPPPGRGMPPPAPVEPVAAPSAPRLRIVHVVRQFAPGVGGLETYVAALAEAQRAQGHHVSVVTLDRVFAGDGARLPARETIEGVPVRRIGFVGPERYPLAPRLLAAIAEAEIVHVHAVDGLLDLLAWTRAVHRKRLVLSTHGGFFHTGFARRSKHVFFHTVTRASLRNVAAVLASSEQDHRLFAPLSPGKTLLIENGVVIERFRGLARPGAKRIIYFGRLAPNKGLDRLIGWFAALHAHDPEWTLVIAGRPMGVEIATLRAATVRAGVGDAVAIHEAPDDEALRALIAECDVYACASRYEGFGMAAVEAVAAGLYPVLSPIPAFARTKARIGFGSLVDFKAAPDPAPFLRELAAFQAAPPPIAVVDDLLAPFMWRGVAAAIEAAYLRVLGVNERRLGAVTVAVRTRDDALRAVLAAVDERQRTIIGFCNAHTVNVAARDPAFAQVLARNLTFNDGMGADLASRLLYRRRFPTNLNGTDFVPALLARLPHGTRVYLLGSAGGIAARAAERLAERFPNIVIAGTGQGFFDEEAEPAIAAAIVAARSDLVLAGMGQPRQELWAARNIERLDCPVICVGALLDFASGLVRRAPPSVQRLGLEWAFRLAMEPRRLATRYLIGNATFLARMAWQWASGRRSAA